MTLEPGGREPRDDDLPPTHHEAEVQRAARIMPLVWLAVGAIVALLFALLLLGGGRFLHGRPASPAPVRTAAAVPARPALASAAPPR